MVVPLRDVVEDFIPPLGVHLVELRVRPADGAQTVLDAPAVEQRQNTGKDWSRSGRPVNIIKYICFVERYEVTVCQHRDVRMAATMAFVAGLRCCTAWCLEVCLCVLFLVIWNAKVLGKSPPGGDCVQAAADDFFLSVLWTHRAPN